jgi:hypothetical protein
VDVKSQRKIESRQSSDASVRQLRTGCIVRLAGRRWFVTRLQMFLKENGVRPFLVLNNFNAYLHEPNIEETEEQLKTYIWRPWAI